jgi:hypothetical protein
MLLSILRHNARADLVAKYFFLIALAVGTLPDLAAAPTALIANSEETTQVAARLTPIFQDQDDFQMQHCCHQNSQNHCDGQAKKKDKRLLVPVQIGFKGVTNSYCRLVTIPADFTHSDLVQILQRANFDDCSGMTDSVYIDLNDDGVIDVVEMVRVKSNRNAAKLTIPIVYLSDTAEKSGYCYSEQASHQLQPLDLQSDVGAKKAFDQAKQRLSVKQFECAK